MILAEEDGVRRIPIIVGTSEAQSIAIALERITPPRPLTHDLFATFAQAFGVRLCEVFIYKFEDGVFYSELLFEDWNKQDSACTCVVLPMLSPSLACEMRYLYDT